MSDAPDPKKFNSSRLAEWILVFIGAAICLAVIFLFAGQQNQDLWPLPGLYFLEIMLLAIFAAGSRLLMKNQASVILRAAPWIVGGALFPFVILGGFSIGPFLFPAMIAFFLAGILADLQLKKEFVTHISFAAMSALLQGAVMVAVNLLFR